MTMEPQRKRAFSRASAREVLLVAEVVPKEELRRQVKDGGLGAAAAWSEVKAVRLRRPVIKIRERMVNPFG